MNAHHATAHERTLAAAIYYTVESHDAWIAHNVRKEIASVVADCTLSEAEQEGIVALLQGHLFAALKRIGRAQ